MTVVVTLRARDVLHVFAPTRVRVSGTLSGDDGGVLEDYSVEVMPDAAGGAALHVVLPEARRAEAERLMREASPEARAGENVA